MWLLPPSYTKHGLMWQECNSGHAALSGLEISIQEDQKVNVIVYNISKNHWRLSGVNWLYAGLVIPVKLFSIEDLWGLIMIVLWNVPGESIGFSLPNKSASSHHMTKGTKILTINWTSYRRSERLGCWGSLWQISWPGLTIDLSLLIIVVSWLVILAV